MEKIVLNPKTLPPAVAPFSHGFQVSPREVLFLAGQTALDEKGNVVGKGDIQAQTRAVYRNLGEVLKAAGMSWGNVMKFNIYLTRRSDLKGFGAARQELFKGYFPDGKYPPSTLVFVTGLFHEDFLLEIEAFAAR